MKKLIYYCFIVLVVSLLFPLVVIANDEGNEIDEEEIQKEVLDQLHIDEVEAFWEQLGSNYGKFITELTSKDIRDLLSSKDSLSITAIVKGVITYLLYEILMNGKLLGSLLVLTIFSTILQTMLTAFEKSTISKIAHFVIIMVLLFITLQTFYLTISYAKESIDLMSAFIIALFPLMLGIIASLGQFAQVAFFHPIIIALIHFSSLLLTKFVFPLLYIAVLLLVVSELNEQFKASHLAQLLRTISLGALGVYLAVFLTILSIQGASSAIQDGVALKTTKFITSNFIPVIGQSVTDAADTILSASLLLKNTLGIVGLIIIVLYALFPALKIAVLAFIYKLVAALLQPLAPKEIVRSLQTISQYMIYVLACLFGMTFTFFLTIVIIVAASNIPLLLR
ncbi:MAG TPA: stage III sporulation protein AE [Pseudogracilibacillus sp.]|nr:stage III sporulation protein AE [Pseudogracilibacillus sp.]